ncbi:acyltransferase [Pedobacter sp. SYSU D00535]|uniref:acyltransferase family protein n=1 Tax=Pedobacter sp. SYSU D00535 TaxID=2810308 RepID=UPI001A97CF66|nr:acyltransferase [Pedobacter sp. SYSU D00535]
MNASHNKKIDSIQFLRAVAVLLVVYVHIIDSASDFSPSQSKFFFLENWGAIGLDLFYIISGFIMTIVTPSYVTSRDWKDFAMKRVLRIIPLYWVLSVFSIVLQLIKGNYYSFEKVMKTLFFFPIFDSAFVFPIIPVGWSLSLEIYFYFLIALLLVFAAKRIYTYLLMVLFICSGIGYFFEPQHPMLSFLFSPLLIEFALGILVGLLYRSASNIMSEAKIRFLAKAAMLSGFCLMIGTIFTGYFGVGDAEYVSSDAAAALIRVMVWGVPSALFLAGVVLLESQQGLKIPRFFTELGDASYSCYLIHALLLIPIARKIYLLFGLNNGDFYILATLVFVCVSSIYFYRFFEKRLIAVVNRIYLRSRIAPNVPYSRKARFARINFFEKATKAS